MSCCFATRTTTTTSSNVRSRPIISGGTVLTDTGQIIRGGTSTIDSVRSDPAFWAACRALGLNTVRIGVRQLTRTMSQVNASIDKIVEAARNNRMYVMLGNPEALPGAWDDNIAVNKAASIAFWGPTADRYRNEPYVFYEMFNEPEAWGAYSHYSSSTGEPTALTKAIRDVFDVMRASAPNTIICAPSATNIDAAGGIQQYVLVLQAWESLGAVDWTKSAWAYHGYNQTHRMLLTSKTTVPSPDLAADQGRSALRWLKARYPLIMTETNWWMEVGRKPLIDILDVHEDVAIGWTIMTHPFTTPPHEFPFAGDLWPTPLQSKMAQLRTRGYNIPVE